MREKKLLTFRAQVHRSSLNLFLCGVLSTIAFFCLMAKMAPAESLRELLTPPIPWMLIAFSGAIATWNFQKIKRQLVFLCTRMAISDVPAVNTPAEGRSKWVSLEKGEVIASLQAVSSGFDRGRILASSIKFIPGPGGRFYWDANVNRGHGVEKFVASIDSADIDPATPARKEGSS